MRPILIAHLDKSRPVLILTRELVRPYMNSVTVAPITSNVRGLETEVPVGFDNGLDQPSVVQCDAITTVKSSLLGRLIGYLLPHQEAQLAEAVHLAFDLDGPAHW